VAGGERDSLRDPLALPFSLEIGSRESSDQGEGVSAAGSPCTRS